jgi:hypothetical protein
MKEQLILEAMDLAVGESKRIYCPQCQALDEKSLKLSRTESGISWTCFRAKCGYRGYEGRLSSGKRVTTPKYPKLHFFGKETEPLSLEDSSIILERYGITEKEQRINGFCREKDEPRLVMPIFDASGDTVGYVSKRIEGTAGRKSYTYWHKERPPLHYPRDTRDLCYPSKTVCDGPVALLEDTLSSVRVARYCRSRALLGTFLSDSAIEQLRMETDHILLALDNDVVELMVGLASRLRGMFKVDIIIWPKDPKDLDDSVVRTVLEEYL